jgi:hypothetical protein
MNPSTSSDPVTPARNIWTFLPGGGETEWWDEYGNPAPWL